MEVELASSLNTILEGQLYSTKKQKPKKTKVAENTAPITTNIETKPSSEIQNPDEVSGEVIAAISAAIAYMGGGKILSVKKAERKKAMGRSAWATAGLLKNTNRN